MAPAFIGNGALWVGLYHNLENNFYNILATGEALRAKLRNEAIFD
jgi:hypothetical protein